MAWPMRLNQQRHQNRNHRDDHDQYRWERPPQFEDGQTAQVHAPRATALLQRQATAPEPSDRSTDPTS